MCPDGIGDRDPFARQPWEHPDSYDLHDVAWRANGSRGRRAGSSHALTERLSSPATLRRVCPAAFAPGFRGSLSTPRWEFSRGKISFTRLSCSSTFLLQISSPLVLARSVMSVGLSGEYCRMSMA